MTPRSYLYVPGDRPEKLARAAERGADALIVDLEDAVAPGAKADARRAVAAWLAEEARTVVWVRVNGGDLMTEDIPAVTSGALEGIYVPKATLAALDEVDRICGSAPTRVTALIETATGVLEAPRIAAHPRVVRLAIGEADLCAELGVEPSPDGRELDPVRMQIVLASAAAGLSSPVGPVSTDFRDLDAMRTSTVGLRRMGFGARAAIHPAQIGVINEVFTPTPEEIDEARRVLAAYESAGSGASVDHNGRMVDEAVARAARRTLARAGVEDAREAGNRSRTANPSGNE